MIEFTIPLQFSAAWAWLTLGWLSAYLVGRLGVHAFWNVLGIIGSGGLLWMSWSMTRQLARESDAMADAMLVGWRA